ncbi:CCA tRNA nucleotidyltransferase [Corallococcus sp. EGB]|uniref:CCA tRNA nucleotidyltransferase n=1 Tax=Corallococcus sp. EGB TaxID=1521117 RepID=UPI001CBDDCD3|nr:CCA tRNA nucleotidyltransferase [Corallococcus sp. EGB]
MTPPSNAPTLRPVDASRIDPDAVAVLQKLHAHGHVAYLSGGCVRDLLVGRKPKDFDLVSSASALQLRELFPHGVAFGGRRFLVVQLRLGGGKVLEISTFRAHPAREHPGPDAMIIRDEVLADYLPEPGTPEQDARSRDFTVNGLFYDVVQGRVLDATGGQRDLQANLLRINGAPADAEERLRNDPGIMLRGARFVTRLGMELEPHTGEAMSRCGDALARCSRYRLLSETLRGVGAGTGVPFLQLLRKMGWLSVLLPPVARWLEEGGASRERRLLTHVEAVDRHIRATGQPLSQLALATALLLPVATPDAGGRPAPEVLKAVLGALVEGEPELAPLPTHAQALTTLLNQVAASPDLAIPGHPLMGDARRLAALTAEAAAPVA